MLIAFISIITGVLLLWSAYDQENGIFILYTASVIISFAFFMMAAYFYQNFNSRKKLRILKTTVFYITLAFLFILSSPLLIIYWLVSILGFSNLIKHGILYAIITFVALFTDILLLQTGPLMLYHVPYINLGLATVLCVFIGNKLIMLLVIALWHLFRIYKLHADTDKLAEQKADYEQFKRELYILDFAIIAILTALIYLFNDYIRIPDSLEEWVLAAFAIYIAFDTLYSKWKEALAKRKEDISK